MPDGDETAKNRSADKKAAKERRHRREGDIEDSYATEAERLLDGDPSADYPALLTKDARGG